MGARVEIARYFIFQPDSMIAATDQSLPEASSPSVFLEATSIRKSFAGVNALRGISLTLHSGNIYHLLGENGCGKSTLIKILSGAQSHDEGELIIDGRSYARLTPLQALAAGIETVYQDLSLIPNLTVAENIALTEQLVALEGRLMRRLNSEQLARTARRALAAINLPQDASFLSLPVERLSIATRQLIAIARTIATRARMVIMDEPTTALTLHEVERLIHVVKGLQRQGVAVLFVSHKLDECYAIGGRVIVMRDGQKVAEGPITQYTKSELSHSMTGKHLDGERRRVALRGEGVVLRCAGLGRDGAFDDVSFALSRREILGVTGLLDSGRNELALALAGLLPASRGALYLGDCQVVLNDPRDAIAQGIGYVPEDRLSEGLFLDKSIRINLISTVLGRLRGRFGMLDDNAGTMLARQIAACLHVSTTDLERPVQSLSGGNQQRVLIGRWLTIEPRVLILHGPTVGVDVGSKDTIYRIIQELTEKGLSVILISDDLPELLQNCDRILVLKKGTVSHEFQGKGLSETTLYRALISESSCAPCP